MRLLSAILFAAALAALTCLGAPARAQTPLLTQAVDDNSRVTLAGNTRPEVAEAIDRGLVADSFPMPHILIQLKRSPGSEAAYAAAIEAMYDPASPQFHRWLAPAEIGARFGLNARDLAAIEGWLGRHGFAVNVVYPNGLLIDVSGTAGQVRAAFRTEIHELDVEGVRHFGNMSDPQIPVALAPAVAGVVALHDFKPRKKLKPRPGYTACSGVECEHVVTPADLATIYDFNPAFAAGYTGEGQTIVVVEDTNLFNASDWTTFRDAFGLTAAYPHGRFRQIHPQPVQGAPNCADPGVTSDDTEASLDAEWASAAAPNARIELASCADAPDGLIVAIQNVIGAPNPPAILSLSYGECEVYNGAASNAAYYQAYMQAAAEGVSVFVSAGDEDAASCDDQKAFARHGIGISALASTPYNVAVGGTDFAQGDQPTGGKYWAPNNSAVGGSARAYIPEIPWNASCASRLITRFFGYATPYGDTGFCNSLIGFEYFLGVVGGSGGPSGCATGKASIHGVVSGSCQGYPKPSWQTVFGNPPDGVRDIPDVSLFASNGVFGAYYVYCDSDIANGGAPCVGAPNQWSGAGGTSFAAPILAGVQALVNQAKGAPQGNPNPVYYALAASQFSGAGLELCQSLAWRAPAASCVFHNVARGDIDVDCLGGTTDCYNPSGVSGVLSRHYDAYDIAYNAHIGWNFATGIGSVDAYNLIRSWPAAP